MKDYTPTKEENSWIKNIFRKFAEIKRQQNTCACWACETGEFTNKKYEPRNS